MSMIAGVYRTCRGVAVPGDLSERLKSAVSRKRSQMSEAKKVLRAKDFPRQILSKSNIGLAALVHLTGLRDYGYVIETAGIFYKYWSRCNGEFSLDEA